MYDSRSSACAGSGLRLTLEGELRQAAGGAARGRGIADSVYKGTGVRRPMGVRAFPPPARDFSRKCSLSWRLLAASLAQGSPHPALDGRQLLPAAKRRRYQMADEVEAVHASITVDAVCKALDSLGVSDRKASTAATEEPAACSRPRKSFGGVLGQTSVIRPFLLLGGKWSAGDVNRLRQHNVTHIVNVTAQIPNSFPSEFAYLNIRIPDADTVDISRHFEPANATPTARCPGGKPECF